MTHYTKIVMGALLAIGTLGGAWIGYLGKEKELDVSAKELAVSEESLKVSQAEVLMARIDKLESALDDKNDAVYALGVEVNDLKRVVELTINQRDYMQHMIDTDPMPVAIHSVVTDNDKVLFPVYMINEAYAQRYKVSKYLIENKTVGEVWDPRSAGIIQQGNLQVFNGKDARMAQECFANTVKDSTIVCAPVSRSYGLFPDSRPALFTRIHDRMTLVEGNK